MRFFIVNIFVLLSFSCFSQTLIKGKVTDTENNTLPGVTVLIPKTTIGTITNRNGVFQIKLPKNHKQLQLSSIGYRTKIVSIRDNKYLHVKLRCWQCFIEPTEKLRIIMPKHQLI